MKIEVTVVLTLDIDADLVTGPDADGEIAILLDARLGGFVDWEIESWETAEEEK